MIAALALAVSACGSDDEESAAAGGSSAANASAAGKDLKIAVLFPDASLDQHLYGQMWDGILKDVTKSIGAPDPKLVFGVGWDPKLTQTTEQLFRSGTDVVINTLSAGPLFYDACKKFPDRKCLEYYPVKGMPENTSGFWHDFMLGFYLEGVAAGKVTKSNTVGFVNASKIPLQRAAVNAYALGCQSVNPKCKTRNVYINAYFDPPKTVEATNTLIDAGADVVAHALDDTAVIETAASRGAKAFGAQKHDPKTDGPALVATLELGDALTGVLKEQLTAIIDGSFEPQKVAYSGDPSNVKITFGSETAQDVKDAVSAAEEKIAAGESPFQGPIKDSKGKVQVPEGESLELRSPDYEFNWTWTVEGLIGG